MRASAGSSKSKAFFSLQELITTITLSELSGPRTWSGPLQGCAASLQSMKLSIYAVCRCIIVLCSSHGLFAANKTEYAGWWGVLEPERGALKA
jgi:hypothetical protein